MTYELRVCFGAAGDVELTVNGWGVWDWLSEHGRSILCRPRLAHQGCSLPGLRTPGVTHREPL